jgi:hypothetical protein
MPAPIDRLTALSMAARAPPPRLMFATAGFRALAVTQSMPAMTPDVEPDPSQPSTRTATRRTAFATPYLAPPTVPATWVPWPLQSPVLPSPTVFAPAVARPPNSPCVSRMPESMTYAVTPEPVAV